MGFAACWLAVRGKAPQTVLAELELEPRGERDDYPVESPIASAELPGGWHLVVFDGKPELGEELLGRLSRGCEAVAAGVEEHVMRSYAEGWQDGERRWHVVHDSSAGIYDLTSSGALPEPFEEIRRQAVEEQDAGGGARSEVDYVFDVPVELARRLTGFRLGETDPDDGLAVVRRQRRNVRR